MDAPYKNDSLHDHRGNITLLINTETHQPTDTYRYSAFGEETTFGSTLNPWRFASKRVDLESGFSFFGRRYYSPTVGRFLTPDPIGFADGPNLYAYVHNSPMVLVDPYGLTAFDPPSVTDPWGHHSSDSGSQCWQPSDFPNSPFSGTDRSSISQNPVANNSINDFGYSFADRFISPEKAVTNDILGEHRQSKSWGTYSGEVLGGALGCLLFIPSFLERAALACAKTSVSFISLVKSISLVSKTTGESRVALAAAKETKIALEMLKEVGSTKNGISCTKQVLLNPPIQITEKAMKHIVDRHVSSDILRFCDRSKFNAGENLFELIQRSIQQPMVLQENGRFVRSFDVGRSIGVDYFSGTQSSILTIVTERDGTLVTMFPGPPK